LPGDYGDLLLMTREVVYQRSKVLPIPRHNPRLRLRSTMMNI
jgi:hypothetical protein